MGPNDRRQSPITIGILLSSALIVAAVGCGAQETESSDAGWTIESVTTSGAQTLEERCTATCQRMQSLSFPTALCEDAGAENYDAYFCQSIYWSPCLDSCMAAVTEAPSDACRESWEPLMGCIASSNGYVSLLFNQPSFGRCRHHIDKVGQACWGHGLDP